MAARLNAPNAHPLSLPNSQRRIGESERASLCAAYTDLVREGMKVRILILLVLLAGGIYDYIENGDRRDRKPPVTGTPSFG